MMKICNNITKQQERGAMLTMLKQREASSPCHSALDWTHEFWHKRLSEPAEIKRVLGVGEARMSDHLLLYKDPFDSQ